MWAIHWAHVPILRIKKTSADFGSMKKIFLMAVVAIATVTNVWGQKYPDGYLTSETYPSYDFIPEPPLVTSGEFAYDFYHYQMGRHLREHDGVSEQAIADEEEAKTFSYPSGHSTRGYMFGLVLCTVMPEKTSDILDRAQYYAYNRVICGHHWKSDTDASLMLAAALFANIVHGTTATESSLCIIIQNGRKALRK